MDPFIAYKYYISIKLHFTNPKFDVFVTRGKIKGSQDTFLKRNDVKIFNQLSKKYSTPKQCIEYFVANFLYGNDKVLYDQELSIQNLTKYSRIKQSITHTFSSDLDIIVNAQNNKQPTVENLLNLYLSNKITIETLSIINQYDNFTLSAHNTPLELMFPKVIMTIDKSKGFVHFKHEKIDPIYKSYCQEINV